MKKEYIVNLQGKDYPTYPGILDEAHSQGLRGIGTELVQIPNQENEYTAIVKATVVMIKPGAPDIASMSFEAYGDASPKNVNSRIATALIRMAETRAKGRALRDAVNVGQTMLEELPQDDSRGMETHNVPSEAPKTRVGQIQANEGHSDLDPSAVTTPYCPVHNVPAKIVPAGISKKTGKAYQSFTACPEKDCKVKPVMGLGATMNDEEVPFPTE